MVSEPHNLYKVIPGSSIQDDEGNEVITQGSTDFLCGCHRHDVTTKEYENLANKSLKAFHKVNLDRRDDLKLGDAIEVREDNTVVCQGLIVDIKRTSGMPENYMSIFL